MVPLGLFPGESDNAVAQVSSTRDGITIIEPTTLADRDVAGRAVGEATITASYRGHQGTARLPVVE